ncbi:cellulose-growth-specific protein [Corynespora cassiicola Philippines]|uniref:lytic cellulose monooxygenase (C4-dehydrogenating) n=1 Tax=Corynespora cassiicola Philippines TaxID=1448308 RepID=A0A2T2NVX2_CORCC|nr:cellulose-growth-specific protein [Corynespora cassiicola Philippines]
MESKHSLLSQLTTQDNFFSLTYNGIQHDKWENVRQVNHDGIAFPELDVYGPNMTCNRPELGTPPPNTLNVTAGSELSLPPRHTVSHKLFNSHAIFHPGPLSFYMAKVPKDIRIEDFDAKGAVFFKISSDSPSIVDSRLRWPNQDRTEHSVTIPACIADGDYLLRVEHIALHEARAVRGAQFYMSCAHVRVRGGSGAFEPGTTSLVAFPGSFEATDPGILVYIWYPVPTDYVAPGGPALVC